MVWQLKPTYGNCPQQYIHVLLFSMPKILGSWVLSLGLWFSCQPKCLFSIALILCQEGKISKFPWMLWSMLITEKSINIKVNAISKSSVAKHYQKSLRIQEKWLPKSKSDEWTSLSVNTFSAASFGISFIQSPEWHLISILIFCDSCEALLSFREDYENPRLRPLSFDIYLYQKSNKGRNL